MAKKSKKRIIWTICIVALVAVVAVVAIAASKKKPPTKANTVKVTKSDIVDKALAIGAIEPINEIAVKSKISGVVGKLFVDVGAFVKAGEPLLEVKPDPTPLELVEAKRNLEMVVIESENLRRELARQKQLKERGLVSDQDYESLLRKYDEAALRHQIVQERLDLLEKGKVRIAQTNIETVIKAPITGFILEKSVNVGDPVVPLTSYQAGTELLKMADMKDLIFKGTVDEIDVGKIKEGMSARLQIGALPGKEVKGRVKLISLKARKQDNTTVFPVEIAIEDAEGSVLRAGFSSNASIIIAQKDSVLSIPERVVTFRNDSAFVRVPSGENQSKEVYIKTGLSDAIQIEVVSGLEDGQEVLEKEVKEII
jgi:HlyD family secretion protein